MTRRYGLFKRILILCILWIEITASVLLVFSPAQAAQVENVDLRASVGFQSYFAPQVWTPVRVSITNGRKAVLAGKLIYSIPDQYPFEGTLEWPVRVGGFGSTRVTIGIPGSLLKSGGGLSFVSKGTVIARSKVVGVPIPDGSELAGVISDHPDAVQFLAGVSSTNGTSELITAYITPQAMPVSAHLLADLSYLYIDGAAAGGLGRAQAASIISWVRNGGILILGGVQPNASQVGLFQKFSPVAGTIVLDQPGDLIGNFTDAPAPRTAIPQLFGEATTGSTVLIGNSKRALVGVKMVGRGEVAYVGLDAASSDLVAWSGNALFWDSLLHAMHASVLSAKLDLFGPNGAWSLMTAADQFPQMHAPPLWIWELVFGVYMLACGPLLYLWLRRRRKNDWAWIIMPLVSIVLAGAIYELGVLQRPNGILTQDVGLIDIVDANHAEAVGVEALMSPQTRSYAVVTPSDTWLVPLAERASTASDGEVTFTKGGSILQFSDVRAWGGRFVYASRTLRDFGQVTGELFSAGRSLGGYLLNDTGVDLADVALVIDGQVLPLGSLSRGASVKVQFTARSGGNHGAFASELGTALTSASHGVGRALFDYAGAYAEASAPPGTVLLIAWSRSEPSLYHADGPILPATPQWIIRQLLPVTPVVE